MGLAPEHVAETSLWRFASAWNGWLDHHSGETGNDLTGEEIAGLSELIDDVSR